MTSRASSGRASPREFAAVAVGGMLGTGLRLAVDTALPHAAAEFAAATLAINIAGSFALAVLVARVWVRPGVAPWLRAGIGTGLLGSFTTFSAVSISVTAMGADGDWMLAGGSLAATLLLGLAAAGLGLALGTRGATARGGSE